MSLLCSIILPALKAGAALCLWVFHQTGKKVKGKPIVRFIEGMVEGVRERGLSWPNSA